MKTFIHIVWTIFIMILTPYNAAYAFRCDGKIVSVGDTKAEVILKCGAPAWKDESQEEIITRLDNDTKRQVTTMVEEWTYNFGPQRFIQLLTFRDGRLVDIKAGSYGYAAEDESRDHCGGRIVGIGESTAEVMLKCGKPEHIEKRSEEVTERINESMIRRRTIGVEEWTYNFGPNRFMRIFIFRGGRLAEIKTGEYGY